MTEIAFHSQDKMRPKDGVSGRLIHSQTTKNTILHQLICWIIRLGTRVLCRIERDALELVPKQGPLIIVTNHINSLEVPILFAHLQPRPITGFAKIETWDSRFMGWLFDLWGAIPIRRGEADLEAVHCALDMLKAGYILGVAPEGTRSWDGKLLRGHPGVVTLALHSGAPILPIAHWGGEDLSKNIKQLKRTNFHIRVGGQYNLGTNGKKISREKRQQMVDEIMYKIAELMPEEYRGEYKSAYKKRKQFTKPVR